VHGSDSITHNWIATLNMPPLTLPNPSKGDVEACARGPLPRAPCRYESSSMRLREEHAKRIPELPFPDDMIEPASGRYSLDVHEEMLVRVIETAWLRNGKHDGSLGTGLNILRAITHSRVTVGAAAPRDAVAVLPHFLSREEALEDDPDLASTQNRLRPVHDRKDHDRCCRIARVVLGSANLNRVGLVVDWNDLN
jgi:hypothetical protein